MSTEVNGEWQFNISGYKTFRLDAVSVSSGTVNYFLGTGSSTSVIAAVLSTVYVGQSGTWNLNNISGTISLPTDAATATNQNTINSTLGSPFAGGSIGNTSFGVNNSSGASAVNIQDGGNSITVDGTVSATQSGTWNVGLNVGSNVIGHVIVDSAPSTTVTGTVTANAGSNL